MLQCSTPPPWNAKLADGARVAHHGGLARYDGLGVPSRALLHILLGLPHGTQRGHILERRISQPARTLNPLSKPGSAWLQCLPWPSNLHAGLAGIPGTVSHRGTCEGRQDRRAAPKGGTNPSLATGSVVGFLFQNIPFPPSVFSVICVADPAQFHPLTVGPTEGARRAQPDARTTAQRCFPCPRRLPP